MKTRNGNGHNGHTNGFYKIEDGIPIPGLHTSASAALRALEPTQSVLLKQYKSVKGSVDSLIHVAQKATGSKLLAKPVEGGVRVWRLS